MADDRDHRPLSDSILGDLIEERRRRTRRSASLAALWFWTQAAMVGLHLAMRRAFSAICHGVATLRFGAGGAGRDLRYALRSVRHAPWYATAVIGVLTLGLALSTTVFAVVDGVLFKPLPYPRADELVSIRAGFRAVDSSIGLRPIAAADVAAWSAALPGAQFTMFRVSASSRLEEVNDEPFGVAEVEPHFFDVIGVRPLLGGFVPQHFTDTSTATIISYRLWQTRFGGALDIVGQRVVRGTASMEIAGVMPADFVFPARREVEILMPLVLSPAARDNPRGRSFEVIARLPPGIRPDAMRDRLEHAMAQVARTFPALPPLPPGRRYANLELSGPFDRADVQPLDEWLSSRPRALFLAVFAAAAALVLLACVNVSGLMAARSLDRQREIVLRRALGARADHVASLVLVEAGLLATAGLVAGLALSVPAVRLAVRLLPADLALLKTPSIDWRVAAFAALLTVISVVAIAIWPIRRGLRASGAAAFADGARGAPRVRTSARFVLVASQVALGFVLTVGGALLVGSLVQLRRDDIGMDARGVFAIELRVPASASDNRPGGVGGILNRILLATRAIPGVVEVGATDAPLLNNTTYGDLGFRAPSGAAQRVAHHIHGITSGFFDVMRPRILAGRLPSGEEIDAGRRVVVVSESVARAFWPDRPAVDESLVYTLGNNPLPFAVVGVVADARLSAWDDAQFKQIYAPLAALDRGYGALNLLLRTNDGGRVLAEMQRSMQAEGPDVRAIRAMSLDDMLAATVRPRRFQSWLFGSFGTAALVIVGVGVLGLMAMTTARRTREVGLRMALGSTRDGVVRLFVREQLTAVLTGIVAGALLSMWATTFVKPYLYALTPYDPRVWIAALLLVTGTAALGTLIPATRASRVDPARALRVE